MRYYYREDWRAALWAIAHCWSAVDTTAELPHDRFTAHEALNAGKLPEAAQSAAFALGVLYRKPLKWLIETWDGELGACEKRVAVVDGDTRAEIYWMNDTLVWARVRRYSGFIASEWSCGEVKTYASLCPLQVETLFELEGFTEVEDAVEFIERVLSRPAIKVVEDAVFERKLKG